MAIRDHYRLDVIARRAAELQEADAQLGEIQRLLSNAESGVDGTCRSCGSVHSRGAAYCWHCGAALQHEARPRWLDRTGRWAADALRARSTRAGAVIALLVGAGAAVRRHRRLARSRRRSARARSRRRAQLARHRPPRDRTSTPARSSRQTTRSTAKSRGSGRSSLGGLYRGDRRGRAPARGLRRPTRATESLHGRRSHQPKVPITSTNMAKNRIRGPIRCHPTRPWRAQAKRATAM